MGGRLLRERRGASFAGLGGGGRGCHHAEEQAARGRSVLLLFGIICVHRVARVLANSEFELGVALWPARVKG